MVKNPQSLVIGDSVPVKNTCLPQGRYPVPAGEMQATRELAEHAKQYEEKDRDKDSRFMSPKLTPDNIDLSVFSDSTSNNKLLVHFQT